MKVIIAGGLFALSMLLLTIVKGDEMYCTNFFTKWLFKTFNGISTSVLFWNALMWIVFISTGIVWPEIALGISILLSILFVAASIDECEFKNQSWQFMSLIIYGMAILIGVGFAIAWIWENTIVRFNNWLDTYKGNKAFDKWKQDNTRPDARNN